MKKAIYSLALLTLLCFVSGKAWGQNPADLFKSTQKDILEIDLEEDKDTVEKINEVMDKIYSEIMAVKDRYSELDEFNEDCLLKNENGFHYLQYEKEVANARGERYLFAFKLDIKPLKDQTYVSYSGSFEYALPMLNLQFSGYMMKHPLRKQFDIYRVLEVQAEEMADYQQQFMPLRIVLDAPQKIFKVDEPIHFRVALVNTGDYHFLVKGLDKDTLFFTFNNREWGAEAGELQTLSQGEQPTQERLKQRQIIDMMRKNLSHEGYSLKGKRIRIGDKIVLKSGDTLTVDFIGEGFHYPKDVEIRAIYNLNVKGLRPTAKLKLKIVE